VSDKRKPPRAGMGRPKGSKNKIQKTAKDAIALIPDSDVLSAIKRGLAARPPASAPYVKLVTEYKWGKPQETVEHTGELRIHWQTL
jgi:hypothetical protein